MGKEFQTRRLVENMRNSFALGAIVIPAGYVLKGVPKGKVGLEAGLRAAGSNGPRYTANGLVIGGLYYTTYHTMKYVRQKDDVWNIMVAGIPTAGFMFAPFGRRIATLSAFLLGPAGGLFFGYLHSMHK